MCPRDTYWVPTGIQRYTCVRRYYTAWRRICLTRARAWEGERERERTGVRDAWKRIFFDTLENCCPLATTIRRSDICRELAFASRSASARVCAYACIREAFWIKLRVRGRRRGAPPALHAARVIPSKPDRSPGNVLELQAVRSYASYLSCADDLCESGLLQR